MSSNATRLRYEMNLKDTGGEKQPLLSNERDMLKDSKSKNRSMIYFIIAAVAVAVFLVYPLKNVIFFLS